MSTSFPEGNSTTPVAQSRELFEQRQFYDGITVWFSQTDEQRQSLVLEAVQAALDTNTMGDLAYVVGADKDGDLTDDQRWILQNFALLTSPCSIKLFDETNTAPLTDDDIEDFIDPLHRGLDRFNGLVLRIREARMQTIMATGKSKIAATKFTPRLNSFSASGATADFPVPGEFIMYNFSEDELEKLLIRAQERGIKADSHFFYEGYLYHPDHHARFSDAIGRVILPKI